MICSLFVSACVPVCLSACLPACLSVCRAVRAVRAGAFLIALCVCCDDLFVVRVCVRACLSVCLPACLPVCLSRRPRRPRRRVPNCALCRQRWSANLRIRTNRRSTSQRCRCSRHIRSDWVSRSTTQYSSTKSRTRPTAPAT